MLGRHRPLAGSRLKSRQSTRAAARAQLGLALGEGAARG